MLLHREAFCKIHLKHSSCPCDYGDCEPGHEVNYLAAYPLLMLALQHFLVLSAPFSRCVGGERARPVSTSQSLHQRAQRHLQGSVCCLCCMVVKHRKNLQAQQRQSYVDVTPDRQAANPPGNGIDKRIQHLEYLAGDIGTWI